MSGFESHPAHQKRKTLYKLNVIRCEYRRGPDDAKSSLGKKRESCSYGWRLLVVFELNKADHLVTVVKRYIPTRTDTYQALISTLHMRQYGRFYFDFYL